MKSIWEFDKSLGLQFNSFWQLLSRLTKVGVAETAPKEEKRILKKKSTKITEETIELTDPKAVAEALGLNEKKKKNEEPVEIEEELDIENLETGK